MSHKELLAEIASVNKTFCSGLGLAELEPIEEDMTRLQLTLRPRKGDFAGACLVFKLKLQGYPSKPPKAWCQHPVFHCNVGSISYRVCFNMLEQGVAFSQSYSLDTYVNGLLWLLENPNPDSAMRSDCSVMNAVKRRRKVQLSLRGLLPEFSVPCVVDGAEPLQLSESELLTWVYGTKKQWWSELQSNPHMRPPAQARAPWQSPLQLLLAADVDFRRGSLYENDVFCSNFRDSTTNEAVLVLSTKSISKDECALLVGRSLEAPIHRNKTWLLPKRPCHVYIDAGLPSAATVYLGWTKENKMKRESLQLRRSAEDDSLPNTLLSLCKRQDNVKSAELIVI